MEHEQKYTLEEARKILAGEAGRANLEKHGKQYYTDLSKKGVEARNKKRKEKLENET